MDVHPVPNQLNLPSSRPPDEPQSFGQVVRSSRVPAPLSSDSPSHLLHDMPPSAFPNPAEIPNPLPNRMHVSIPEPSMDPMNILSVSPSKLTPTPGHLPGFQCENFGLPRLDSKIDMGHPSSAPIPSMHSIPPPHTVGTSSLATALNAMDVSTGRSRAGSSASPGTLISPISAIQYPPVNTGLDAPVVQFPPSNYVHANEGQSPELQTGGPLLAVIDTIAETAKSLRVAYSRGQNAETNVRIDELKRAISWVSDAIAKEDGPLSLTDSSPPHRFSSVTGTKQSPPSASGLASTIVDPHALSLPGNNIDGSDVSRKRCASSMAGEAGDRVIKAPKMEPQDINLSIAPPPTNPHLFAAPPVGTTLNHSLPPSAPTSRPPSPGLPLNLLQQQPQSSLSFSHILPPSAPPIDFGLPATVPTQPAPPFPLGARNRSSWSDTTLSHRHHQHSLSGTSLNAGVNIHGILPVAPPLPTPLPFTAPGTFGTQPLTPPKHRPVMNGGGSISPPVGRIARSGSINSPGKAPSFVPAIDSFEYPQPSTSMSAAQNSSGAPDSDDEDETEEDNGPHSHSSPEVGSSGIHGNEVPQEYRAEVDRIFFEFLNKVCSNLDAADSKGEPIHQTLMAKKMQRLDESPDFRPFKFRIAAFTNAFLEELSRQGYPEEKIPMKKIRNYLWRQVYIQRFNEDGKKAKSKGNHIWNIDAKKGRDGGWIFRPFHRRLAGSPPGIAYVGLRWSWTPRIWDPQASSSHIPVQYSSPVLPHWLSWKEDVLSGIPPPDAESCDITAEASFVRDGQEEKLSLEFHLNIAPISTLDTSFASSRRPSLANLHNNRRVQSDSVIPQVSSRSTLRGQNPPPVLNPGSQVMQVLTYAAQRVAQEAQSQVISPTSEASGHGLQALAKQQHVLTMTAAAFDKESTGQGPPQSPSSVLAAAAQQVVMQAARTVRADRSAAANVAAVVGGVPPSQSPATQQVTVNEVSVATQTAVAQAVEITGPLSSEVDVLITATSLLQNHARGPNPDPNAQLAASMDTSGANPAGSLPPRPFGSGPPFPSSHPPLGLPEYEPPT